MSKKSECVKLNDSELETGLEEIPKEYRDYVRWLFCKLLEKHATPSTESDVAAAFEENKGLRDQMFNLTEQVRDLYEKATIDPVTGVPNRASFELKIKDAVNQAERNEYDEKMNTREKSLSMLIIDIDLFKEVNDNFGHLVGDHVLKSVADILKREIRKTDFVARFGGDEFVILLPGADLAAAAAIAEKLRKAVAEVDFLQKEGQEVKVTLSIGVATKDRGETKEDFLTRTDSCLYGAKIERNSTSLTPKDED